MIRESGNDCRQISRQTFPYQLHALLCEAERIRFNNIIAWQPSGESFIILQPNEFETKILPQFFRQTKISSFKRQLNAYGFQRHRTDSLDLLVYSNLPFFIRDSPEGCTSIHRRRSNQELSSLKVSGSMPLWRQPSASGADSITPMVAPVEPGTKINSSDDRTLPEESSSTSNTTIAHDEKCKSEEQFDPILDEMAATLECPGDDNTNLDDWNRSFDEADSL